jgi:hypothetical protein
MSAPSIVCRLSTAAIAAALAGLCSFAPAAGGRKAVAPYSVAVEVAYGERVGSESMREWAARELVREIDEAGCFATVRMFHDDDPEQADLLVRVVVDNFEEKSEHETTMAQRDDPNAPPTERLRLIASLEVWGSAQMRTLPGRAIVRERSLHLERGYRPSPGEDPAYEVRLLVVEALSEDVRRWACKGAGKKLPEEIERARAQGVEAR